MSADDYAVNKLQYPGHFKCSEIALISSVGKVAGIKSAVIELNIYESLFSNFLTGDITFVDTLNLIDELPITGHEFLDFKIRTPIRSMYRDTTTANPHESKQFLDLGGYDFTNRRMSVYNIAKKQTLTDGTAQITLNFCSPEGIRNQNVRMSRAFEGPYDEMVADIFKKEFGLNSKKRCYIQPTKNNFKYVAPNKRPLDIINVLASRAQPKTSTLPGYLFYENGQGFHFRSMDSFFFFAKQGTDGNATQKPLDEMFEFFCSNPGMTNTQSRNEIPLRQMRFAIDYDLSEFPDIIHHQRAGTYASKLISYDAYNKTISTNIHNYIDDYHTTPHMEKGDPDYFFDTAKYRGLVPKTHYDPNDLSTTNSSSYGRSQYKYLSDYSDARIMMLSKTSKLHNTNMDDNFRLDETTQKRQMALQIFNTLQLKLTAHGNTHLNAGHIVRVNLPRPGMQKTEVKSTQYDKNLTGRWLITAVRHNFNFADTVHKSVYTCIKETYGRAQLEDAGPLSLTTDDEGKAINLYDDSEYN